MNNTPFSLTFLGTGTSTGVPMICCDCEVCTSTDSKDKRLRSSVLIKSLNTTFVIDTTPDFRYQMLRINNQELDAVLFTHPHKDHIGGLDDIRPYNHFLQKAIHIYANELTEGQLRKEFYYAFEKNKVGGLPDIVLHTIHEEPFVIGDLTITPILVWHKLMPVYGYRIGDLTYITDANRIDDSEKEKIKGSKVLIINALRKEKHPSHFTLDEAINLATEVGVETTYFTHVSHQLGLHNTINKQLPAGFCLAYDGLTIEME